MDPNSGKMHARVVMCMECECWSMPGKRCMHCEAGVFIPIGSVS